MVLMFEDEFVSQDETRVGNSMQCDNTLLFHLLLWQHPLVPLVLRLAKHFNLKSYFESSAAQS